MQIVSRNTNTLQTEVYNRIQEEGVPRDSRNGPVLKFREPVLICLTHPYERVNFCPVRDANPFFHLIEAMAMLDDRNDVRLLSHFASQMKEYTDDGTTYNSFYGTRLRSWYGDQLSLVIRHLQANPDSRQEVALIWNPSDLDSNSKDKACNLLLIFSINEHNQLEMTSVNRSNDAIWGFVSGANIVHLSIFMEYVALSLDRTMGHWWHVSNNMHVYTDNPKWTALKEVRMVPNYYLNPVGAVSGVPLFKDASMRHSFDRELWNVMERMIDLTHTESLSPIKTTGEHFSPFILTVVSMFNAWQMYKLKAPKATILHHLEENTPADDWRCAGLEWMQRHIKQ